MDAAVCYEIWGIDRKHRGAALSAEADAITDWIYGNVGAFVGFGSELCNLYFSSKLAQNCELCQRRGASIALTSQQARHMSHKAHWSLNQPLGHRKPPNRV
jgi:hypothetical protein